MKRVTIKDVARESGVSVSAVSRAFSDGSLSFEKRQKVLSVAERLGYRPSSIAQGLVQQKTNAITLVTGRMFDAFDAIFVEELAEGLADTGRRLIVAPASKQRAQSGGVFQAIDDRSDAVIVAAGTMPLTASEACARIGLPVILVGRFMNDSNIDCVAANNSEGGHQAGNLLLRTGCVSPAYFGFETASQADQERRAAFQDAMQTEGNKPPHFHAAERDDEAIFNAAIKMLTTGKGLDCVFCASDQLALGVIQAAQALGVKIPHDLSIIGFNNIPAAARQIYSLTTIDYQPSRIVKEILEVLDMRFADPAAPEIRRRIPVNLIARRTTRQAML